MTNSHTKLPLSLRVLISIHENSDNHFQRERDWILEYLPRLTQTASDCKKLIDSEMKISKAYDHLSTTLSLLITAPNGDERIALYNDVSYACRGIGDGFSHVRLK